MTPEAYFTTVNAFITWATDVNFTNILWTAFGPKSFCQKITNPNYKHIKAAQKNFHMKKLLIKYWCRCY